MAHIGHSCLGQQYWCICISGWWLDSIFFGMFLNMQISSSYILLRLSQAKLSVNHSVSFISSSLLLLQHHARSAALKLSVGRKEKTKMSPDIFFGKSHFLSISSYTLRNSVQCGEHLKPGRRTKERRPSISSPTAQSEMLHMLTYGAVLQVKKNM